MGRRWTPQTLPLTSWSIHRWFWRPKLGLRGFFNMRLFRQRSRGEWAPVFESRFIKQLPQREAAKELGMPRTTLVYQEQKIRALLQRFLLGDERR